DRLAGFQEAMDEAGLSPVVVRYGNFTYESGYEHAQEILQHYYADAIMCGNDLMAIGVIHAVENLNAKVPEDVGVTGFDDLQIAALIRPSLTSVRVPCFDMGKAAANALLLGGELGTCEVELVARKSCAPRRSVQEE
ncbi:MAG: substrate-binding domain-containing protein, partial [Candidatus Methanomethyliaceae archaeon]